MKKRMFIFLFLAIVSVGPVCAMETPKNVGGMPPIGEALCGDGQTNTNCFEVDSDIDSDSDEELTMPTLGDVSDSSESEEDIEKERGGGGDDDVTVVPRDSWEYLDLAMPLIDLSKVVAPSDNIRWQYGGSERPANLDLSDLDDAGSALHNTGERFSAAVVLSPTGDIDVSPLPDSRIAVSVTPDNYFGQGLSEGEATAISRGIDEMFISPVKHVDPDASELSDEDDLILPATGGLGVVRGPTFIAQKPNERLGFPDSSALGSEGSSGTVTLLDACVYNRNFKSAIGKANERLSSCPGIVEVKGRTAVLGDLHGDLNSLKAIMGTLSVQFESGELDAAVFLGDIMDRGENSALTLLELLNFFNTYDGKDHVGKGRPRATVYIVRGNHETREMYLRHDPASKPAREDLLKKGGEKNYKLIEELLFRFFDNLPYAAIINGTTLALHGGVPAEIHWKKFGERKKYNEADPGFSSAGIYESIWSDYAPFFDSCGMPPYVAWSGERGGSTLCFNEAAAKKFLESLGLKYMIRGHQPTLGVFHRSPNGVITTVFSAIENQGMPNAVLALVDDCPAPTPYGIVCAI